MKTFEITKEQILEVASWGNRQDLVKLREWFPQAFESELEVGRWYKSTDNDGFMFYIKESKKNKYIGYGILEVDGEFHDEWWFHKDSVYGKSLVPATDKEVETALIAEAKRRGFKDAVKFNVDWEIYGKKEGIMQDSMFKLNNNSFGFQTLCQIGQPWIFCNGKWAKIISDPIELTLEQRIERIEEQLKIKK